MATPIPDNYASFALAEVARITRASLRDGDMGHASVTGVVTDSRAVRPGTLFVALRGERFDGAAFAASAVTQGAAAVLIARASAGNVGDLGVPTLVVDDPTEALGDLARAHRARWGGTVVAITGSVGKTTSKELTAHVLERGLRCSVAKTVGNLNNAIGLPATLLCLDRATKVAVVELGTSGAGEIARLASIAAPDVAVVTRAAVAHTEGLGTVEAVAVEKTSLFEHVAPTGAVVACRDDDAVWSRVERASTARRFGFGRTRGADVCLMSRGIDATLSSRVVFDVAGRHLPTRLGLLGEGAAMNAAAALAVGHALGADLGAASAALSEVRPVPGRLDLRRAARWLVLDDSYNASPRSMELALETAAEVAEVASTRVVVVLGDMKELGAQGADAHAAVAEQVARAGAAVFVGVGPEMRRAVDQAAVASRGTDAVWAPDVAAAEAFVAARVHPGDLVLVKGSRSMHMERIVDRLLRGSAAGDAGAEGGSTS